METEYRYTAAARDHFERPRNLGELADADGVGTSGGSCDAITIWIRVRDDRISEIAFACRGCPAAIACGSATTELAKGRGLDEAAEITHEAVEQALGGLPKDKRHTAQLAAEALGNAILDYVVRGLEKCLGDGRKGPAAAEEPTQ